MTFKTSSDRLIYVQFTSCVLGGGYSKFKVSFISGIATDWCFLTFSSNVWKRNFIQNHCFQQADWFHTQCELTIFPQIITARKIGLDSTRFLQQHQRQFKHQLDFNNIKTLKITTSQLTSFTTIFHFQPHGNIRKIEVFWVIEREPQSDMGQDTIQVTIEAAVRSCFSKVSASLFNKKDGLQLY